MSEVTPRVDATLLENYKNKVVRIIGKIQLVNPGNETAVFDSNGTIKLLLTPDITLEEHNYYEITCKVSEDLSVRALNSVPIGTDINERAANALVRYAQRFPELFG